MVTTRAEPGTREFKCAICHMPVAQLMGREVAFITEVDEVFCTNPDGGIVGIPHRGRLGNGQGYCTTRFFLVLGAPYAA